MSELPKNYTLRGLDDRPWKSDKDRDAFAMDRLLYGTGTARQEPDGTWVRIPPEEL